MRVMIKNDPFISEKPDVMANKQKQWPANWVSCSEAGKPPFVTAYCNRFKLDDDETARIHVTADERYELFIDGKRIGRGPERGDCNNWFYESYELQLTAGEHVIVARVWSLGDVAPFAQMSTKSSFLLAAEGDIGDILNTGKGNWLAKKLGGYDFEYERITWGTGANERINGSAFDWGFERGECDDWQPVVIGEHAPGTQAGYGSAEAHLLKPATLPAMLDEKRQVGTARHIDEIDTNETWRVAVEKANSLNSDVAAFNKLLQGNAPVTIDSNTTRRVIIDLDQYYCAYTNIIVSGGKDALLRVNWAEALYDEPIEDHQSNTKSNRDEIEGMYFIGVGDQFMADGGNQREISSLWWQAGRYIELLIKTADSPLTIDNFVIYETRYPLEMETSFTSDEPGFDSAMPIMLRALQMCSHETYMDCPYYEQLMYVGDTRLEVLATYCTTLDSRLPRKALAIYDASRTHRGLTQSRYPSRVLQYIPPFSLWWVAMVYDYARWRDDPDFVKQMMPGVRSVIEAHLLHLNAFELISSLDGWNFMDWVNTWPDAKGLWNAGVPIKGNHGVSGILNWQLALVLTMTAKLESEFGDKELADRANRVAARIAEQLVVYFWDEERGLFADDMEKTEFSEHAQCLAVLTGLLDENKQQRLKTTLFTTLNLVKTTIYFSHYLLETCAILDRMDMFDQRLKLWFKLEEQGFKTTYEFPGNTRSDCHAWGAHPIYHCFATILGIRPAQFGFKSVEITPQLGELKKAAGTLVHPLGNIEAELISDNDKIRGSITLPKGLNGTINVNGKTHQLKQGKQNISV